MNQLSTAFTSGDYRYAMVERAGTVALYQRTHVTKGHVHFEAVALDREQYPGEDMLNTRLFRSGDIREARQAYTRLVQDATTYRGVFAVPTRRARKQTTTRP